MVFVELLAAPFATGYWANTVTGQQTNHANQVFTRRLASVDYTLKWQELHREDIRDLMCLTTQRMDLYHMVGTLLLTFGIEWFTSNGLLDQKDLPFGFVMLFLASNYSAIGYLIFSVWLAMHAAIASQSIGTRLLTSYARLSVPSVSELNSMSVDVMPLTKQVASLGAQATEQAIAKLKKSSGEQESAGLSALLKARSLVAKLGTDSKQAVAGKLEPWTTDPRRSAETEGGARAENCDVDPRQHFMRFLEEQQRWLSYDAYARACMSLGMNQLLQALSYYLIATTYKFSVAVAVICFIGVIFLALLLMRLDIADGFRDRHEIIAVVSCFGFPPLLASVAMAWGRKEEFVIRNVLLLPCFFLHGSWAFYTYCQVKPSLPRGAERMLKFPALLPLRWRQVTYLNVIDAEQRDLAKAERSQSRTELLGTACKELQGAMRSISQHEKEDEEVSDRQRHSREITTTRDQLEVELALAKSVHDPTDELKRLQKTAEDLLAYCDTWQRTPEVLAIFESLRSTQVQAWLDDEQKSSVQEAYQSFLKQCESLHLILVENGEAGSRPLLHSVAEEQPTVRVDTYWASVPQSVHVNPTARPGQELVSAQGRRTTSLATALQNVIRPWASNARRLSDPMLEEVPAFRDESSSSLGVSWIGQPGDHQDGQGLEIPSAEGSRRRSMLRIPRSATPPEQLPGRVVRLFTFGVGVMWFAFAAVHFIENVLEWKEIHPKQPSIAELRVELQNVSWPKPATMFRPQMLHCNSTQVTASNRFAVFTAQRPEVRSEAIADFTNRIRATQPSALLCNSNAASSCSLISRDGEGGKWFLTQASSSRPEPLPLPLSWRGPLAVSSCAEPCEAWLAGFDGATVIVGVLSNVEESWSFEPHLEVSPQLSSCSHPGSFAALHCKTLASQNYSDVLALHVGADGHLLVLLRGGLLDSWDLEQGLLLSRWQVQGAHSEYEIMCYDGAADVILVAAAVPGQSASLWSGNLGLHLQKARRFGCGEEA
eukprot:TRINITY_DN8641_c0_g1_i5.p1 TRINITY_DN8641_c0_g1~~TRINITY_DN8641_c0_g1_i5.p1  ORF type:complete len:997 (+),score=147.49 TRINITY_DN8641_c0_g1_i5:118-3108(+)